MHSQTLQSLHKLIWSTYSWNQTQKKPSTVSEWQLKTKSCPAWTRKPNTHPTIAYTWGTPSRRGRGVRSTLLPVHHDEICAEKHDFLDLLKIIRYHLRPLRITLEASLWFLDITWMRMKWFQDHPFSPCTSCSWPKSMIWKSSKCIIMHEKSI